MNIDIKTLTFIILRSGADYCGGYCANGACKLSGEELVCVCDHGFKGAMCNYKVSCDDITCENNGTCSSSSFTCKCDAGFKGDKCETGNEFDSIKIKNPLKFCKIIIKKKSCYWTTYVVKYRFYRPPPPSSESSVESD